MSSLSLRRYQDTDHDWLVEQHQTHYTTHDGFDESFGPLVSQILTAYSADYDPTRECGWIAEEDGVRLGSIFCVKRTETTAQLRLFYLRSAARGQGLGKTLLQHCQRFAKDAGYADMVLWTHESHRVACALYRASGWRLESSETVHSFGQDLVEQKWSIRL